MPFFHRPGELKNQSRDPRGRRHDEAKNQSRDPRGRRHNGEAKNQSRNPRGRRHNDEAKKFAVTLNYYSPRGYQFLRGAFPLPHPKSLCEWTSSLNCEPVFLMMYIFVSNNNVEEHPSHAEYAPIGEALSITIRILQ